MSSSVWLSPWQAILRLWTYSSTPEIKLSNISRSSAIINTAANHTDGKRLWARELCAHAWLFCDLHCWRHFHLQHTLALKKSPCISFKHRASRVFAYPTTHRICLIMLSRPSVSAVACEHLIVNERPSWKEAKKRMKFAANITLSVLLRQVFPLFTT